MQLPIFILAAGASRRLGRPKQLVTFNGETLIHRQCRVAIESGVGRPCLIVGCGEEASRQAVSDLRNQVTFISNDHWQEGLASSLRLAATTAGTMKAPAMLILHGDQYGVTASGLRALAAAWQADPSPPHLAHDGDYVGPPAIIPTEFFPAIQTLRGEQGARSVLHGVKIVEVAGAARDVDTPEDLRRLP